jgi:hypothetical protein
MHLRKASLCQDVRVISRLGSRACTSHTLLIGNLSPQLCEPHTLQILSTHQHHNIEPFAPAACS